MLGPIRADIDDPEVGAGVGVPSRPMNERDTELARESDGVGGIDAEGPNDPMWEADSEEVRRGSFAGGGGASTHPKRAAIRDVSETSDARGGPLSSTCMADGSSGAGLEELMVDTAERSKFSCEGVWETLRQLESPLPVSLYIQESAL